MIYKDMTEINELNNSSINNQTVVVQSVTSNSINI